MNFPKIAEQVIEKLGGKNNIATAAHCATRLRIVLNDESKVDKEGIEAIEGVKGQFSVAGQYQIIFGSGTVNKVHEQLTKQLGIGDVSKAEVAEAALGQQNLLQRIVKGLADIFVPIIPAIVAGGLLMGLYSMLTSIGFFWDNHSVVTKYPEISDLVDFINTIANAPFVFLPVLLGFSATRKFGGNPFLGAALGMLLVHPSLSDGWNYAKTLMEGNIKYWNVFGLEIEKVGYQGTVIPTIISAWVLATLEKNFRKFIPSYLDNLITPMFSLFIAGFLAFTVIGPFGREAGSLISAGLTWLYDTLGFFGGAIFGTLYAPIVITGMHQTFIAVETQLLAEITQTGGTFIFPIAAMSNIAQGAACLGVALALKDAKIRGLAVPSGISALLGITEPAMFGVNLRYRQAFIAAMIGSGLASAFIAFFNVKAIALGAAGFLGIPSIKPDSLAMYSIGMVISFVVAFSLSFLFVKRAHTK
ncbi:MULTISPECIES: sucrose-specific PTS transporter subunit IIBC [Haemophilus]|jgi:PTS system sucrose-specific IIBC component|uniref:protein-N(pi)-phosphohistidine--sucrose phosphotransferase n=1 Tax=Haemophilus haemolyticus TaxID=726 RepID=A0A502LKH4_HAEHA|nr:MULTISPECIES: sucrose-specific PTS transporter subunit IIBC [Haemophilus]AVM59458.1 PTS maltose transporter subunit IIBC [Haemophilus sp. oral taxon 036]MBS6051143.1 sucrose-specific PTS transporter subunit IIBC [Haemophilus haemolyticus]MDU3901011.1 sucrose-specific PTS transporter subunit IIBC [Haemophilus haemolyticus]TPH23274.1 PTS maltose transporter subunit IIBC [Haemophilus haemolyticus]TPH26595.1 PTS maltose transporter subunit IIBC [Haemophilus haemolyticus]